MLTVGLIAHDLVEGPVAGQDAEVGERCVTAVEYPNLGRLESALEESGNVQGRGCLQQGSLTGKPSPEAKRMP